MTQKPTIVFDLDGTLADTVLDLVSALNRSVVAKGLTPITMEQAGYFTGKGLRPMIELAYRLNEKPLGTELLEELFEICVADYENNLSTFTRFYPGAEKALDQLASQDWRLAVCTNKPVRLAEKLLEELHVASMFASITGGDSFEFRKPDPRHLVRTVDLAGGKVSNAIMVGDTDADIIAAQKANIPVIAVDFGYSEHPVSTYNPDTVISSYDDLILSAQNLLK